MTGNFFGGARGDDRAAAVTSFWPKVDDPVGALHHIEVVFDHHQRVALVGQPLQHGQKPRDISKVQTGGRLVEHIKRRRVGRIAQLGRELDPLRLAAGKRGGSLTELDISKSHLAQAIEHAVDLRMRVEELQRVFDRCFEHIGDGLAAVLDFKRFACIALAVANLASNKNIGKEVHFNALHALALARLAASALDIEGEPPRLVAADLRLGYQGPDLADLVEYAGVGRWIGSRRAADRRLIDLDHPRQRVESGHACVFARRSFFAEHMLLRSLEQDVVD